MVTPEEISTAYRELTDYHTAMPHLTIDSFGIKCLPDTTLIATTRYQREGQLAIRTKVNSHEGMIGAVILESGLFEFKINFQEISLKSIGSSTPAGNLRIHYEDIDPEGTEQERFLGAAKPFVAWLRQIDTQGHFEPVPITIRQRLNTYAASRSFERFMRTINPNFDISAH
jgi:hypothetical protein